MELRRAADDPAGTCFWVRVARRFTRSAATHQPEIRQPTGVQLFAGAPDTADFAWSGVTVILGPILPQ